jgi:Tfp pilus assembly protein PilO
VKRRGPIVVAAIFTAVAILAVLFFVLPKMSAVGKAHDELMEAEAHEQELQLQLAQLKEAQQQAPEVEQRLAQLKEKIPPSEDMPGVIRQIADAAATASVNLATLTRGTPAADGSGSFAIVPISVSVAGSFFALDEFLLRLESLPRAMKILSTQVTKGSPPFELSVALSVEVYTTDVSSAAVTG